MNRFILLQCQFVHLKYKSFDICYIYESVPNVSFRLNLQARFDFRWKGFSHNTYWSMYVTDISILYFTGSDHKTPMYDDNAWKLQQGTFEKIDTFKVYMSKFNVWQLILISYIYEIANLGLLWLSNCLKHFDIANLLKCSSGFESV